MVYVFGIDIPLFELQLIFFVVMTAGLALVLFELKRLTVLIGTEKSIVNREEEKLSRFERDLQKMEGKSHADVVNYVRDAFHMGMTQEHIKKALLGKGWDSNSVEDLMKSLEK